MLTYTTFTYLVIACLAVEAALLFALWIVRKKGLRPLETISFLGAGASFSIALLVVASGGPLYLFALSLCFAFIFHMLDMLQRWQR